MKKFDGIVSEIYIEGIGNFVVEFYPDNKVTYEKMLKNKKYIAQKIIEQLNKIFLQAEVDFNEKN